MYFFYIDLSKKRKETYNGIEVKKIITKICIL